ncbi:MAG: beta strand repeat-containing protein [Gemmatimonadales bacterium]
MRWLGLVALAVAAATCRDAPLTGPGRGGVARLAFQPVLAPGAELATFGITIDSLRVVVIRPVADTLEDTTAFVHPDSATIQLAVTVLMQQPAETLIVAFEFHGAGLVLFAGEDRAEVIAGPPGTNAPITDTLTFVGPGSGLTNLDVQPVDTVIQLGDSLRFRVTADQAGAPLTQFFVAWTTSDTLIARINHAGVLRAPPARNRVYVKVRAPNGVVDSTSVTFVPPATTIAQAGGNGQSGTVGTLLPQPIRVRVTAGDALGVKGTLVTFAVTGGGGSVAQGVVVTDDTGFAQTTWTLGPTPIAQSATATATGLAGSPVGFTATAIAGPASQLVFTVPPATTPVGTSITPAVEVTARDAGGNTATTFTGDVSIAIGTNPSGGTVSGTTTMTVVDGVATFSDLSIGNPGTGYTLIASAPGLPDGTSAAFDILPPIGGRFWLNAGGGNWSNPANWSGGVVPAPTDTVFISLDGTYTVTLDVSDTVAFLFLGGGTGTQTLSATSRTFRVDSAASILPGGELSFVNVTLEGSATGAGVVNQGTLRIESGTVAPALANDGLAVLRGAVTFTRTVSTTPGSVFRVEGDAFCCTAVATVANDFSNLGTIELVAVNASGTSAELGVTSGTLVNAAGGQINVLAGTGGARNLTAQLDNQGTVTVEEPLTVTKASAAHTNSGTIALTGGNLTLNQSGTSPSFTTSGTITIASGLTLSVNFGVFDYAGGAIGGLGALAFANATAALTPSLTNDTLTLSFVNSTVNGPGTLGNAVGRTLVVQSSALNAPVANQGVLTLLGATGLNGAVTTAGGSTLRVEGDAFCCTAVATVANGFTNLGTIELVAVNASGTTAQLTVTSGTLVNAPSGQINVLPGTGGARTLTAQLDNQGTVKVEQAVAINRPAAAHTNSGLIEIAGGQTLTLTGTGTTLTNEPAGTIRGSGALNVSAIGFTNDGGIVPGTSPGLLQVTGAVPMSGTAALNIELGGLAADTLHDQLAVSGAATLAGTLNVTLIGGFTPSIGNNFTILTAGSLSGTFGAPNLPTLPVGSAWQVTYGAADVVLSVVTSSQAPVILWTNPADGNWSNPANWSTGVMPAPADSVVITLAGTYTVALDVATSVAFVNLGGASGMQTLAIGGQTLTLGNGGAVNAATGILNLSAGTLTGGGTLTVDGTMNWTGGTMSGAGVTRIGTGGLLNIAGAGTKTFSTRTVVNAGQVVWSGGQINSGLGAVLQNQAGATVDVQANAPWAFNTGGSLPRLSNLAGGVVKRTVGTGTATLDGLVDNNGTLDVQTGTLLLSGGGTSSGTFTSGSGAVLDFGAGTYTLGATSKVSGAGLVNFSLGAVTVGGTAANAYDVTGTTQIVGGTVTFNTADSVRLTTLQLRGGAMQGAAPFVIRGTGSWTGGTLSGPAGSVLQIPTGVTLAIGGTTSKTFTARTILNLGTVNWTATTINASDGATFDNQPDAAFNVSAVASWAGSGTPVPRIENRGRGTIKVTTAGTTSIGPSVVVNNTGTLDIQAGATLKVSGDFNNLSNGGELLGSGTLDVSGSAKVANNGVVRPGMSPGILTIAGNWPQPTGSTLVAEVFDLTAGTQHDQLKVTGATSIGGALQVVGNGVFVPKVGEFVTVLTYGAFTGQFAITYSSIPPARQVTYTATGLVLTW